MWSAWNRGVPRIGRTEVWQALLRRRQRVRLGSGGFTLIESASGLGKSTFLESLMEDSRTAGFRVTAARASPIENPIPFTLIGDALAPLRSMKAGGPPEGLGESAGSSMAFLPALEPVPARLGSEDPLRAAEEGGRSELASGRFRLIESLAEPFLRAAESLPLLVALDDLQWADDASIELLTFLAPRIGGRPIWIVGTVEPTRVRARGAAPLAGLLGRSDVERLVLRPLSAPEVEEYVRWSAPHRKFLPGELRRLAVESAGSPSRLMQLLFPAAPPKPRADGKRASESDLELGIGDLSTEARRLLNFAVVAGGEFSLDLLAEAAGVDEERAIEHVEQFVERGLVRELELGRFGFTQEGVRFQLYSELLGLRVRLYHQRLAEALERRAASDPASVYALAQHSYLGRLDERAVRYNRAAAELAASSFQPGAALPYLRQALEALRRSDPDDARQELALRLDLALQQARANELEAAEASLREIRSSERLWRAAGPSEQGLLAVYQARVLADLGRWDDAEQALAALPTGSLAEGRTDLRLAALRLRGEILYYRGSYPEALAAHDEALRVAETAGEAREAAAESIRRATVLSMLPGREDEALGLFRAAVDRLVALGDPTEAAYAALCLGAQLSSQARPAEARAALERAIALAEQAHDLRRAGWAYLNLADLDFGEGRLEDAADRVGRARSGFEQVADSLGQARTSLTEGRLALASGDLERARRDFEAAADIFEHQHLEADGLEVELRRAELDLARRDTPAARDRWRELERAGIERLRPDLLGEWRKLAVRVGESPSETR